MPVALIWQGGSIYRRYLHPLHFNKRQKAEGRRPVEFEDLRFVITLYQEIETLIGRPSSA